MENLNNPLVYCDCCQNLMAEFCLYKEYKHFGCNVCGYEKFLLQGHITSNEAYEDDPDYKSDLEIADNYKDMLQWAHIQALIFLKKAYGKSSPHILDVGCFNGFFVKELRRLNFDAFGIDFNRNAIEFGISKYGLDKGWISNRSLEQMLSEHKKYDVITMFEVIEHLDDFIPLIRDALSLLLPGGILIISTPNSKMCWRPILDLPPHHLSRFTPVSLEVLLKNLDLKVLLHREQMSVFDLCRNYLGSKFRISKLNSMRGGEFKNKVIVNKMRLLANKLKWFIYFLTKPIDVLLSAFGFTYISQVIVVQKRV